MALAVPIVNGRRYDFSSLEVLTDGIPILGRAYKSVGYRESKKPGSVRGNSAIRLGRTRGPYEASGEIEIPKEELDLFLTSITGGGVIGYLEAVFEITVAYADLNAPLIVDHLNGCQITDIDETHASGGDGGLVARCSLDIQALIRNGKLPLSADAMLR